MNGLFQCSLCSALLCLVTVVRSETIRWFCDPGSVNGDSTGASMDGAFQFELGVFAGGFQPTVENRAQWLSHWSPAQAVGYSSGDSAFSAQFTVTENTAPFSVGAEAWVFGQLDTVTGSEWVLFRHPSWTWPAPAYLPNPDPPQWDASNATMVVAGVVDGDGSPFLMQSEAIQSFTQWQAGELAGEPLNDPDDDPDRDGSINIVEFLGGSDPMDGGSRPTITVGLEEMVGVDYLQMECVANPGSLASWRVEVGSDLVGWTSDPSEVEVTMGPAGIVARDLTAVSAADRRFMRLEVLLP